MNVDGNFVLASATIFSGVVSSWAIVQYRQNKTELRIDKLENKLEMHGKDDTIKHDELSRRISEQEISRAEIKADIASVLRRLASIEGKFDRWFEILDKRP